MKTIMSIIDYILDFIKRILVRFKNDKFGLSFIINIFILPDFLSDKNVNIIRKFKVIFSLAVPILYFISAIDIVPEIITGIFGFIDDIIVMIWSLGKVNEELDKYKKNINKNVNQNIINDDNNKIKDEDE